MTFGTNDKNRKTTIDEGQVSKAIIFLNGVRVVKYPIVGKLKKANPYIEVIYRDLAVVTPSPHMTLATLPSDHSCRATRPRRPMHS
jgi:hypothetical protein